MRDVALAVGGAASVGLVAALPTMTHFALAYGAIRPSKRAMAAVYTVAPACALLDVFAVPHPSAAIGSSGGVQRAAALGSLGVATYCAAVAAAIAVIVIVARLYLAGRK